jgi:Fe-S cluster biogenesis protein NfuA
MIKKIKTVIDNLAVYVRDDGGDMQLVSYDNKKKHLIIKVLGACVGCENFDDTFNDVIKKAILIELPTIRSISFI